MPNGQNYSPGPWEWTEFGTLSDAEGVAVLDSEDWNITPENAILIASAPELLGWITKVMSHHAASLPKELVDEAKALITKATDPAIRS